MTSEVNFPLIALHYNCDYQTIRWIFEFDIRWFDRSICWFKKGRYSMKFDIRYSMLWCSNIKPYRISNLFEPLGYSIDRTIKYRTFSNPSDIRSVEPSNLRIFNRDRMSRYSIDPTMVRYSTIEFRTFRIIEYSKVR